MNTAVQAFKQHGKKKTKHMRYALLLYILENAYATDVTPQNWKTVVSEGSIIAAEALMHFSTKSAKLWLHISNPVETAVR